MNKWVGWIIAGVLLVGGCVWAYQNRQKRLEWDASYQAARSAFARTAEYRDAGTLLYEPRFAEFERSEDQLAQTVMPFYGSRDKASRAKMISSLRACRIYLTDYRDELIQFSHNKQSIDEAVDDPHNESSNPLVRAASGKYMSWLYDAQKEIISNTQDSAHRINSCISSGEVF